MVWGRWIVSNKLWRRPQNNNKSGEQTLPSVLSSFHSALLIRRWNTVSHDPSSARGIQCLHYNITFTVITSRTDKISHSPGSQLYRYTQWDVVFGHILLGNYWSTRWPFYFWDGMESTLRVCSVLLNQCCNVDTSMQPTEIGPCFQILIYGTCSLHPITVCTL